MNWNFNTVLDSTELLTEGASSWTEAGRLPVYMHKMTTVSVQNTIIMTGKTLFCI